MENFYVYFLRRPDREDPFEPGMACVFYVGKGKNGRKDSHLKEAKMLLYKPGRKSIKINIIHSLWKQGLDFEIDILFANLSEQEAFEYEIEAITAYGRINNGTGCLANLTDGGEGQHGAIRSEEMKQKLREIRIGRTHTEETKKKMSDLRKGKRIGPDNPMFKRKHTEDALEKIRKASKGPNNPMWGKKRPDLSEMNKNRINPNLGKPMSVEQKILISEAVKGERNGMYGRTGKAHPRFGKSFSPEAIEKMKRAKIGFVPWNKGLRKEA